VIRVHASASDAPEALEGVAAPLEEAPADGAADGPAGEGCPTPRLEHAARRRVAAVIAAVAANIAATVGRGEAVMAILLVR
jgi:hypothetical protein